MMTDSLKQQLPIFQQRNIEHLNQWLEKIAIQQQPLTEAMKYALLLGGKRARPRSEERRVGKECRL